MIDVDNFKKIIDFLGHQAEDHVLRKLVGHLIRSLRQADIVFRYNGDEFIILLPNTNIEQAKMLLKKVLSDVEKHSFKWKSNQVNIKISYGIPSTSELEDHENEKDLTLKADKKLCGSKRSKILNYAWRNITTILPEFYTYNLAKSRY